ncbi:MAG TPA: hypothetical protein PKC72_13160 [Chitinophagaceae bacterium]|nr:hypothetical protein [Chitinophagaceae bacterium]
MLQHISWSDYLTFIALSGAIYYAWVLFVYYRHDLLPAAKAKQPISTDALQFRAADSQQTATTNHKDYQPKAEEAGPPQMLQSFTDEVKAYIEEASNKETEKEILLQCLYVIAGKYPSLAQSEYRDSLDQFLISEAEMNCAVFLSDSEVRRIWNEA